MKLVQALHPRDNALNAWRLTLALGVIFVHAWALTGRRMDHLFVQFADQVLVDGFFVISGFLITSSWVRKPRVSQYLAARGLRIFPGLWVCLLVVAFVIAPIGVAIQGGSAAKLLMSSAPIEYVLNNAVLNVYHAGIAGTPRGIPWPGVWNGSLWTLIFEVMLYITVVLAGVAGLLKRRWPAVAVFALALVAAAVFSYPVHAVETIPQMVARFALVFAAGAVLHQFQDMVPARWSLVALCAAIVIAASLFVPNYRTVAVLPLAYAVIVSGALIKNPRLRLPNDLSYGTYVYAWPIQQLLIICGLGFLPPVVFGIIATIATLPLAALSWFQVEKRAMRLKSRFKPKTHAETTTEAQIERDANPVDPASQQPA